jgi:hypothetical protein
MATWVFLKLRRKRTMEIANKGEEEKKAQGTRHKDKAQGTRDKAQGTGKVQDSRRKSQERAKVGRHF